MAERTGISWCDATFNPIIGCSKVSPACKHCYAERDMDHRYGKVAWGPMGTRVLTSGDNWKKPLKWNREAAKSGKRLRVFCASLADVFEDWQGYMLNHHGKQLFINPDGKWSEKAEGAAVSMRDVRQQLFNLIDTTPNLDWLLLTKRPENIKRMVELIRLDGGTTGRIAELDIDTPAHRYFRRNVWLGCSVENQEFADKRLPELMKCRDLSPVLFLSCEPLLGPVEFSDVTNRTDCISQLGKKSLSGIDWVIAGGESGPEARPSNPDWFRSMRDQSEIHNVPFHFKQWGEWAPYSELTYDLCKHVDTHAFDEESNVFRVGVKQAGRMLDGVLHDAFPEVQQKHEVRTAY